MVKDCKKSIFCIIFLSLLILGICFLPFPHWINVKLTGYAVTTHGSIQDEVTVSIKGWQLNYLIKDDMLRADIEIQSSTTDESLRWTTSGSLLNPPDDGALYCTVYQYIANENGFEFGYFGFTKNMEKCIAPGLQKTISYVSSTDGIKDAAELLEAFPLLR